VISKDALAARFELPVRWLPPPFQKTHVALSLALDHAVKLGWLDQNPADNAVRPRSDTEDRPVIAPNPEAIFELLAEAERIDPEWACYIRLSASLGSRRGETVALRWSVAEGSPKGTGFGVWSKVGRVPVLLLR
jgi:integrase